MKKIIGLLFILTSIFSYSAEVEWSDRLEGNDIIGGSMSIIDGDYGASNFIDINSFAYIRLGLNERVLGDFLALPGINTISVDLSIVPYDNSGNPITPAITTTIEMEYSYQANAYLMDASDFRMPGVHRFNVTVTNVKLNGNIVSSLGNYTYLQAGVYAERYYALDLLTVPQVSPQMVSYQTGSPVAVGTTITTPTTDEVYLNWEYIDGSEEYELEWTWVDNYSITSINGPFIAPSVLPLTEAEFKTNSTRIRTSDQFYRIPQIFAKGYLVYRVRAVGRWLDDTNKDLFGAWSSGVGANVVLDWNYVEIAHHHEGEKNWQYQSTYAEDGKKKEVTQYFDGSLRGRQTVTRINSDDQSVVGETIYDNEGRGVVQILPVPQNNPAIKFYPSINESGVIPNTPYSHFDFDWEENVATCDPAPANTLSPAKGAARYYSPAGYDASSDQEWQQYVPSSDGYAFTQVEYTPDNTGRIRNQSGVGPDHAIASGHETYYYYTQPYQEELDRLFGYKVGYKSRYKKNMVVDANGQVSVSYLDAQGRVIATALAGDNVTSFDDLSSESDNSFHKTIKTDLLNNGNSYIPAPSPSTPWSPDDQLDDNDLRSTGTFGNLSDELAFETQLAVPQTTDFEFNYDIRTSSYMEECDLGGVLTQGVNFPYVYDLDINLLDDCASDKLDGLTTIFDQLIVNNSSTNFPLNSTLSPNQGAQLDQGSYTLSKSLRVNQQALETYKIEYLSAANACILTWDDFNPGPFSTDGCITSCKECAESLGANASEYMEFVAQDLNVDPANFTPTEISFYTNEYNEKVIACYEPCKAISTCDVYDQLIRMDVTPNGQYANPTSGTPGQVSIFSSGYWRSLDFINNIANYYDQNGNIALIEAYPVNPNDPLSNVPNSSLPQCQITPNGQPSQMVEPWQLIPADFILMFESSWTEALMPFHPEYPLYEYASEICSEEYTYVGNPNDTKLTSEAFDNLLREQIMNLSVAATNNYGVDFTSGIPIFSQDPYFLLSYSIHPSYGTAGDLNQLKSALMTEALTSNFKGQGMTMMQYAIKTVKYGNDLTVTVPTETWANVLTGSPYFTTAEQNAIWSTYKSYYLSYKAEINQLLMDFYGFGINYNGGGASQAPGIFNGCIGGGNFLSAGILPSFSFSTANFGDIFSLWIELWGIGPSGSTTFPVTLCNSNFDYKELRFYRVDALSNPANSPVSNATQLSQDADFVQWQQTGLCPLTIDMERLVGDLLINHQADLLATGPFSQVNVVTFVPDLYEAFTGTSLFNNLPTPPNSATLDNVEMDGIFSATQLTINFNLDNALNTSVGQLLISQPIRYPFNQSPTTLSWLTYGSSWIITNVHGSYLTGNGNEVQLLVSIDNPSTTPIENVEYIISYTLSGTSTLNFNNCPALQQPTNDPDCQQEEEFEGAMLNLLQTLISENEIGSSSVDLTLSPYDVVYGQSILGAKLGFSNPTWNGVNGIITTQYTSFYLGTPFNGNVVFVTGFDMNQTTSIAQINWMTGTAGNYQNTLFTTTYSYTNSIAGAPPRLNLECPCETTVATKHISEFVQDIIQPQANGTTHTYLTSVASYLGIQNPLIYNWNQTSNEIFFDVYDASSCTTDENGTVCEGPSCIVRLFVNQSNLGTNNNITLAAYAGDNQFTLNINGIPASLFIECLDIEPCEDCVVEPLTPVSCQDAYGAYKARMETLYGAPFATQLEQDIFESEHLIDEQTFCGSSYAFITDAYLNYLTDLSITSPLAINYLTITEFGTTPLGYSNALLNPAVNDYVLSSVNNPSNTGYLPWGQYVTEVYMINNPEICPAHSPAPYISVPIEDNPCDQWENNIIGINAINQYNIYLQQMGDAFEQAYIEGAMTSVKESFYEKHIDKEYHYTLYTYDRAGNLISTVPPKGVNRLEYDQNGSPISNLSGQTAAQKVDIANYRENNPPGTTDLGPVSARLAPDHSFETEYRYNSLNQLVYQHTPDGGESRFAYDALGRLVMSQNDKQKGDNQYSYTKYDELGRVIEVGELTYIGTSGINDNGRFYAGAIEFQGVNSLLFPDNLSMTREEVTHTIYDELNGISTTYMTGISAGSALIQIRDLFGTTYSYDNTRNRIVGVIYQESLNPSLNVYESASFYDYDVHGNVKHLIQIHNAPELVALNQHIKHVEYTYDLVSGNVNKVIYQKEQPDQFMHRYVYDSDNRITIAETSKDGIVWEKDAKYFYYAHGPLARTEIGEKKVQSSDYAYTIQGWLKTVNGEKVDQTTMMGQDGLQASVNGQVARDAYGFSLSYFDNDYQSANTNMLNYTASLTNQATSLYNGNIRRMQTALSDVDEQALLTHQTSYGYDQLNRIKSMEGYYPEIASLSNYSSSYNFDENGNLKGLKRYADLAGTSVLMDNFEYNYQETANSGNNNQLSWVSDQAGSSQFANVDIDSSMLAGNYRYDEIGQLITDVDENITNIKWKVTNKVEEVEKVDGNITTRIHFDYDPMGNRIAKHVKTIITDPVNQTEVMRTVSTFYVLDAQGNCMSIYEYISKSGILSLTERNMYGSARVGIEQINEVMAFTPIELSGLVNLLDVNVVSDVCSQVGWNFGDANSTTTVIADHQSLNFDSDADFDLKISSSNPADFYSAHLTFNTVPGQTYNVSYSLLSQTGATSSGVIYSCSPYTIHDIVDQNTAGNYSLSFVALSTKARLKFYNIKNTPSAQIVISDLIIQGPGDLFGTGSGSQAQEPYIVSNVVGDKRYELANHLGNVLEVITDRKLPSEHPTDAGITEYYTADVVSFNDYYPYGMLLPYSCREVAVSSCGTVIGQVQSTIVDDQFTSGVDHWVCSNPIAEVVPENGKLRFNYPLRYTSFYRYHKAVIGQTYTITFDFDMGNTPNIPGGFGFGIEGASPVYYALNSSGTYTYTYVATSETMKILFSAPNVTACPLDAQGNNTNCYYFLIDNVKVDGAAEVISCPKNYVVNNEFTSGAPNWEKTVSYMNDPVVINDYLEVTPYSRYTGIKKSFATQVGTKYYVEFAMDAQDFNRLEYRVYNETTGATVTDYFVQSGNNYFTFVAQHASTTISFTAPDDYSPTSSKTFKLHEIQVYDYGTESGTMEMCYGNGSAGDYRYGFQGQEKDDEVKGEGNSINYEFRMHDPRIGRFLAVDPLVAKYPNWSPYTFSGNQVIHSRELEGLEPEYDLNNLTLGDNGRVFYAPNQNDPNGEIFAWKAVVFGNYVTGEVSSRGWNPIEAVLSTPNFQDIAKKANENFAKVAGIGKDIGKNQMPIDLRGDVSWLTQFSTRFGSTKEKQNVACWKACRGILQDFGVEGGVNSDVIQTAKETSNHSALKTTTDAKKGVDYINSQLDQKLPILVGVNHTLGNTYNEGTTDHFVVIVGRGKDSKGVFYTFYDVGTSRESAGTSDKNKLYLQKDGSLFGSTEYNGNQYTVTQVRKNTGKTDKKK